MEALKPLLMQLCASYLLETGRDGERRTRLRDSIWETARASSG
jgi:hypothetical protein